MTLSTHILDTTSGRPAAGVAVRLERGADVIAEAKTDGDGRIRWDFELAAGTYRLVFDTGGYLGPDAFFPEAAVSFRVVDSEAHLHVPLLLGPYTYTTYRGS
ncbi:hydroxyisourate hydrolase [Fodinicola acaciae]|uniref:hydroxyisourate hydrolase n=1 Tax=Fodinicola acaciae TaxID=2681555 RepID=UPI0013D18551|nr:hydroxyisourate hydrolase [Fodinicola acaciae]